MDPISVIILAAIYAALRGPREAGRAVRGDYRGRRDRWSNRAEPWMTRGGRGRGGRRVAGYDRGGRAYTRDRRDGRGDRGWRRDPKAWRGPEGRARVARGIRPSAIRAGIAAGALAYTALFGAGVAARGFARGTRGGYRMGRAHYRAKRNAGIDPSITVETEVPHDPDAEIVDAEIVEDPEQRGPDAAGPTQPQGASGDFAWIRVPNEFVDDDSPADGTVHAPLPDDGRGAWVPAGWVITVVDTRRRVGPGEDDFEVVDRITVTDPAELRRRMADIAASPYLWGFPQEMTDVPPRRQPPRAGWEVTVFAPGSEQPIDRFTTTDPDEADAKYAAANTVPGLRVEIRELDALPDPPEDSRPQTAAGPITNPGGSSVSDNVTGWTAVGPARNTTASERQRLAEQTKGKTIADLGYDYSVSPQDVLGTHDIAARPVGAAAGGYSIGAPVLMEGANYDAHLHNLNVIAKEARAEYSSAELTLASASAARQRAEHAMAAVEQMAAGLAAQDFGETHVGNMASLHEMLSRHVAQALAAERAASESLATSEQLIEMCVSSAAVFQRDHGQLAEAHANAPHAAKTREAYQPL